MMNPKDIAILALSALASCATITRGTKDTLVVNSTPAGAVIELSNGLTGTTPASFKLPRSEAVVVRTKKEGYEPVEVNVTPQISGGGGAGMAGNVILGGLIGAAVDAGSGAMKDLRPNPVEVTLSPVAGSTSSEGAESNEDARSEISRVSAELRELEQLLGEGLITQDEYDIARRQIIQRMTHDGDTRPRD